VPRPSFSNIKQKDWIKACKKLGMEVDKTRGKGSHCLVKSPTSGAKYTIQKNLHNIANLKIYQKMLEWGIDEDDLNDALK
jgi:predicted RNA binding protein YcfA (HicA-like mRNA interferase family)